MSPIIGARGGLSASAYGLFTPSLATNSYESIATATGSGANSVTFSSLGTYKHLQIRGNIRCTGAAGTSLLWWRFNSDSTISNYAMHGLGGDGSTAFTYQITSSYGMGLVGSTAHSSSLSSAFTGVVVDIFDFANTNKNKTVRSIRGEDYNGSGEIRLASGVWLSTSAITSITIGFLDNGGSQFATNSSIALYGIKG
jgi:hypothetical protein